MTNGRHLPVSITERWPATVAQALGNVGRGDVRDVLALGDGGLAAVTRSRLQPVEDPVPLDVQQLTSALCKTRGEVSDVGDGSHLSSVQSKEWLWM